MRSMWNGTLHLAELAIPIGLAPGKGRSEVQLKTLHRACRNELEQIRECPIHGAVADDELVKAWEASPGEYVLLEKDELEAAEKVADDHRMDVIAIVDAAAIEPTMVVNTYFVKPSGRGANALKPYLLVAEALAMLDAAALVRYSAFRGEHVAALRAIDGGEYLIAQTLVTATDVRDATAIAEQLKAVTVDEDERELGRELIERMVVPFDPEFLANGKRDRVKALVEQKLTGDGTVRAEPVTETTRAAAVVETVDLADALKRSLKATKKPRRRRTAVPA